MALQDLTPQLRTRLSRMERAVGWFVIFATALLLFGFGFYVYKTAQRKGWFTPKFKYQTSLNNAAGLKVGDPVKLMGFAAGEITGIIPNAPDAYFGVTINFTILKPQYGYIWDDSRVTVSSDVLGNRSLEITKGKAGIPTIDENTNRAPQAMLRWKVVREARKKALESLGTQYPGMEQSDPNKFNWFVKDELLRMAEADRQAFYTNLTEIYWIPPNESPALTERLEKIVNQVEAALPNFLNLTNQLVGALSGVTTLASNLNTVAIGAQPMVSNLTTVTAQLDHPGALGEWLLPTNISENLNTTLISANTTVGTANTNLENLNTAILNLADITSNLNHQVQMNSNILSQLSTAVKDTDDLVQGLKRHWLLRSAFKKKTTNAPPTKPVQPTSPPKGRGTY